MTLSKKPVLVISVLFSLINSSSCVGPAEPDHGLVENLPAVVSTANAFTYSLRGKQFTFEENYDIKLTLTESESYIATLVVADKVGTDTTTIQVLDGESGVLNQFIITGNTVKVATGITTSPKKVKLNGKNFSGILELVLAKD